MKKMVDKHPENQRIARRKGFDRHQYLEDLGYKLEACGTNFTDNRDPRRRYFKEFKDLYGVDPRETWDLDITHFQWLYERVMAYKDKAEDIINLNYHKITIRGKTYTQLAAMSMLLRNLRYILTKDWIWDIKKNKRYKEKAKLVMEIWGELYPHMWW